MHNQNVTFRIFFLKMKNFSGPEMIYFTKDCSIELKFYQRTFLDKNATFLHYYKPVFKNSLKIIKFDPPYCLRNASSRLEQLENTLNRVNFFQHKIAYI